MGIVVCPACASRYRIRRVIPDAGARMECPRCGHAFSFTRADLDSGDVEATAEQTLTDQQVLDMEASLAVTGLMLADDADATQPLATPREPASLAPVPVEGSPMRQNPAMEAPPIPADLAARATAERPRLAANEESFTGERPRSTEAKPVTPTPPAIQARRLLAEERYVTSERYIPITDKAAPVRWGLFGAAATLTLLMCTGVGGYAAYRSSAPPVTAAAAAMPPPSPPPPAPATPPPAPAPAAAPAAPPAPAPAPEPEPEPEPRPEPQTTAQPAARPAPRPKAAPVPAPAAPAPAAAPKPAPASGSDLVDPWN